MSKDAPPAPTGVDFGYELGGRLDLAHNRGDDWVMLMIQVTAAHDAPARLRLEGDWDDATAVAIAGLCLNRAGLDNLIAYLTGIRDQWRAAA